MIYFIINCLAGGGMGAEARAEIIEVMNASGVEYIVCQTEYAGHAIELAREISKKADCSGIVAVGGDGTFSEVLNGMDTRIPLGLIPCGTGNDFASGANISRDIKTALLAIIGGKTAPMDYLTVGNRRCLNIAGTGFDVDILAREANYRKRLKSKLTYYLALFVTVLSIKFRKLHLVIDDEKVIDTDMLITVAANGKCFGGGMKIVPSANTCDGVMDVLVVKRVPLYIIPKLLASFLRGNIEQQTKHVDIYRCSKVYFEVENFTDIEVDGEIEPLLPAEIKIHSGELKVFCGE